MCSLTDKLVLALSSEFFTSNYFQIGQIKLGCIHLLPHSQGLLFTHGVLRKQGIKGRSLGALCSLKSLPVDLYSRALKPQGQGTWVHCRCAFMKEFSRHLIANLDEKNFVKLNFGEYEEYVKIQKISIRIKNKISAFLFSRHRIFAILKYGSPVTYKNPLETVKLTLRAISKSPLASQSDSQDSRCQRILRQFGDSLSWPCVAILAVRGSKVFLFYNSAATHTTTESILPPATDS